jgi:hypothetical protein
MHTFSAFYILYLFLSFTHYLFILFFLFYSTINYKRTYLVTRVTSNVEVTLEDQELEW